MRTVAFSFVLSLLGRAAAQPPGAVTIADEAPETLRLTVGHPIAFTPPELPVSVICDDLKVVRVQDAGTWLRLTGLKPGATECSLGTPSAPGRRRLYRIEVLP